MTQKLLDRVTASSDLILTSDDFDKSIYAADDVKTALIEAQKDKCAFCEAKVTHIDYGAIEHFRPKAAYQQSANDAIERPGYYWLAYTWENLLFSCKKCNSRHKGSLFPLANPHQRARAVTDDLMLEQPLFINPADEEPEKYIRFHEDEPRARNNNRRGRATIDSLGLKRETLREHRRAHLKTIKRLWQIRQVLFDHQDNPRLSRKLRDVETDLKAATEPTAEYSAMARDYLLAVGFLPNPGAA